MLRKRFLEDDRRTAFRRNITIRSNLVLINTFKKYYKYGCNEHMRSTDSITIATIGGTQKLIELTVREYRALNLELTTY